MDNLFLNEINAYTKIALENRDLARMYQQKANSAKSITEYGKLILESRQYAIVSIIFSAFTLEAYINDYAARKGLKKQSDRLGFINKWIEIPKLVTGEEFPKDQQCYQYLEELKESRNKLAHPKSQILQIEDAKEMGEDVYSLIREAEKAVSTIFIVVKCLTEIDSDEKQYLLRVASDIP